MKWRLMLVPMVLLLALAPAYSTIYSQVSHALSGRAGGDSSSHTPGANTTVPGGDIALASIMGSVVIGPMCPVEIAERPCPAPDYSGLVLVFTSVNGAPPVQVGLSADGFYSTAVSAGSYSVTLVPCGELGCLRTFPVTVVLEAGTVTTENFSIDTGIR